MKTVIFKPLPPEPFFERLMRWVKREKRPHEDVYLRFNGQTLVINRGKPVELDDNFYELARHSNSPFARMLCF